MKVTAVLLVVVILFAIPLWCVGDEEGGVKGAVKNTHNLACTDMSNPQCHLKEESLKVIADSKKWLKRVVMVSVLSKSHVHEKIKRAFEEMNGQKQVKTRAKRILGSLTSCLADAGLSAIDKACDKFTSDWTTTCHTVISAVQTVTNIAGIAGGDNAVIQSICEHLGELTYQATEYVVQFFRHLFCEWAQAVFGDSVPQFIENIVC